MPRIDGPEWQYHQLELLPPDWWRLSVSATYDSRLQIVNTDWSIGRGPDGMVVAQTVEEVVQSTYSNNALNAALTSALSALHTAVEPF